MTPEEFKAWFEGFTDGIGAVPNQEQWEKIKKKVACLGEKKLKDVVPNWNTMSPYQPYVTKE